MRIIITGTTGMVGEGVMLECLNNPLIDQVVSVTRRSTGTVHPKLKEIIHSDFHDINPIADQLTGFDGCFFCLGVSSIGLDEEAYSRNTYELTMHFAKTLSKQNPKMVFCYVSGAGTDSSEKGRQMWARVKGRTENDLMKLPFRAVYNFRPAVLSPVPGQKKILKPYKYFGWLLPFVRKLMPRFHNTLQELARAMIYCSVTEKHDPSVMEVEDIRAASTNLK